MRATGHRMTGLAVGVIAFSALSGSAALPWLAIPAGFMGGDAPDRLEWIGSRRWIRHRTFTHWLMLWLALLAAGLYYIHVTGAAFVIGYAAGGLMHFCGDLPNPAGVPLWTPVHRVSLRWWHSGDHDFAICLCMALVAGACVWWRWHA